MHESRLRWAREAAISEIDRLAETGAPVAAYRVAQRALRIAPDDPQVRQAWNAYTIPAPIRSDPPGATVELRAYSGTDEGWIVMGTTPTTTRIPMGLVRWRLTKPGYESIEIAPTAPMVTTQLLPEHTSPEGMVYVPAAAFDLEDQNRSVDLPAYWIDEFEVTNRRFKEFMDRGGYRTRQYWPQPFVKSGRELSWDEAMDELKDTTGRPGPSTWELGALS